MVVIFLLRQAQAMLLLAQMLANTTGPLAQMVNYTCQQVDVWVLPKVARCWMAAMDMILV